MKKSLLVKLCILSLVVVCAAMSFVACKVTTKSITVNGKSQVFAGEFALADYSLTVTTSDGNTRTEPLTAQNLANVTVEQLQRAGMYNISAVYDGVTTTFALTVVNRTFDGLTFADKAVTYNGSAQSIEVANLPQGATVTYSPSNTFTNAGVYTVTATVSAPNFDTVTLSATLTINKASYDMSQVVFTDKSVAYDGNAHSLEATNLPDGVTVTYIGNNQTNVGTYTVMAVFSGDSANYNPIANMTATLTVTQNKVQGVTFDSRTVTYDGAAHSLAIEGNLPHGIAVVYEGNKQTNAGTYTVTAKFVGSNPNYEQLPDMTATLTIEKCELQIEFVGEQTAAYTGYAQKPLTARATNLCGSDTVAIDITYDGDVVDAGTYVATATVDSDNYKLTANNTCTFTITRATHKVTFRQSGQPDKVYNVLDLADFVEAFPDVVPVENYDVAWEEKQLTRVTEDVIVNAVITPTVYKITYILDGGIFPYNAPWQYTIETETFDLPEPQRDYYSFEGWYTEDTFANRVAQVSQGSTGNVTLYAKWQQTSTEGLQYKQLSDGSYAVSGYDGDYGDVLIAANWKGQPVTAIGDSAFQSCDRLTSVIIPDSVTSIGGFAFRGCTGLTSVIIPDSVTNIGVQSFYNCTRLTSVTIGSCVRIIDNNAFSDCSGLTSIFVNEENGKYIVNDNCLIDTSTSTLVLGCQTSVIPTDGSVTSIGNSAFFGCSGLTIVTIPDGVTSIGDSAFLACRGLTSVTIPDSVTYVGSGAFGSCDSLLYNKYDNAYYLGNVKNKYVVLVKATSTGITSCTINDNCKIVAQSAFSGCNGLTSIFVEEGNGKYIVKNNCLIDSSTATLVLGCQTSVIPTDGSVKRIGEYAFEGCRGLTNITIPNGVIGIENWAFSNCTGLTSIIIPDNVISIGSYAFFNCGGLTSITIGSGVTSIGEGAFFNCGGLTSIFVKEGNNKYIVKNNCLIDTSTATLVLGCQTSVIPTDGSVTSIGDDAFYYCGGLTSITIPNSVTSIDSYAFYNCSKLTSVTIPDSVTKIGDCAFLNCTGLTNITIGNGVRNMGNGVFSCCSGLEKINFNGTIKQWSGIEKGSGWNEATRDFIVYCIDGRLPKWW